MLKTRENQVFAPSLIPENGQTCLFLLCSFFKPQWPTIFFLSSWVLIGKRSAPTWLPAWLVEWSVWCVVAWVLQEWFDVQVGQAMSGWVWQARVYGAVGAWLDESCKWAVAGGKEAIGFGYGRSWASRYVARWADGRTNAWPFVCCSSVEKDICRKSRGKARATRGCDCSWWRLWRCRTGQNMVLSWWACRSVMPKWKRPNPWTWGTGEGVPANYTRDRRWDCSFWQKHAGLGESGWRDTSARAGKENQTACDGGKWRARGVKKKNSMHAGWVGHARRKPCIWAILELGLYCS